MAPYFDLELDEAHTIVHEVAEVCSHWADRASSLGIGGTEISLMSSAFEHEDLEFALRR